MNDPGVCPSCGSEPESVTRCAVCGSDGPGVLFTPFEYRPGSVGQHGIDSWEIGQCLANELAWVRHGTTPRMEYYHSRLGLPYSYGVPEFARTYESQPTTPILDALWKLAENEAACRFDVCFLNRYLNQKDHLGWHSDNSPEMDDARPIAIISLGVERAIDFRRMPTEDKDPAVVRLKLGSGSICIMRPGMQDTHQHRIPKAGFQCGERISLTFRGYVAPAEKK